MRQQLARKVANIRSLTTASCVALGLLLFASVARADEDIATLIAAAEESFTPVSDEQVADAKSDLKKQASALERYLRPKSANGKKWLAYLQWEAFQEALAGDGAPAFKPIDATYDQLNKDNRGLELKPFRNLSDAIRRYKDRVAIAGQQDQARAYAGQLGGLASELESYKSSLKPDVGAAIGIRLNLLDSLGQAPELVAAVRNEFSQPNAFVTVSTDLLRAAAEKPIDRRDPITDVILGTRIRGNGRTTGSVTLRTVPSDDKAILQLDTDGRVVSQNVGRNGPAVIRSTGYTNFDAKVVVELTENRFVAFPAQVRANTSSRLHSVSKAGGGLGTRMVSSIGMDKAREKQGQANRIAASHAETRIARRMTDEIDDRLAKAWNRYQTDYWLPLVRRGAAPEYARFSTTDASLNYETTQADRGQLAAPSAPSELPTDRDLVARLHQSAINNYVAVLLSGATLSESKAGEGTKADVNLPTFVKDAWKSRMDEKADEESDAEFEPWSLTFRASRPITVAFADGKVALTLHIARLVSGDDEPFRDWNVTATYTPELADGRVTLSREGELEVLPSTFDPDAGKGMGSKNIGIAANITKVLTERSEQGRGIPKTITVKPIEPQDEFSNVGTLPVTTFDSESGWLTVAWDRE